MKYIKQFNNSICKREAIIITIKEFINNNQNAEIDSIIIYEPIRLKNVSKFEVIINIFIEEGSDYEIDSI